MSTQGVSTNNPNLIDLGNAVVYIGTSQASLTAAKAYTGWRRLGLMKDGSEFRKGTAILEMKSGTPLRTVKKFITEETAIIAGTLAEISADNLNRVLGSPGITVTT